MGVLAALVLVLLGSWAYGTFVPHAGAPLQPETHRVVRVQVLNGSGEGGIGSRVASYLRAGGFHVVEVRNADRSDYFATMVVARRADGEAARMVARYLGGPPVIQQSWGSDVAEVTVVLGSDRSRLHLDD
jgi:predicted RecB family endonuclease